MGPEVSPDRAAITCFGTAAAVTKGESALLLVCDPPRTGSFAGVCPKDPGGFLRPETPAVQE